MPVISTDVVRRYLLESGVCVMTDTKQRVEQRKHKRFKVLEGAFAALRAPWPHSTRLGQIIDIGMGGLAFS